MYPIYTKLHKQLSYADKKKIPFVIIFGETEYTTNRYTFKDMQRGVEYCYTWSELCQVLGVSLSAI